MLMIDYGNIEYLPSTDLLPVCGDHDVFEGWAPQAICCSLFDPVPAGINYEARWLFNGAVKDTTVLCKFGKKVLLFLAQLHVSFLNSIRCLS